MRRLLALVLAFAVMAGPAFAAAMHAGPAGCGIGAEAVAGTHGEAAARHARHHDAAGHRDDQAPRKHSVTVIPCCLAGCLAAAIVDAVSVVATPRPVIRAAGADALAGHDREPADPPPRPVIPLSA